VALDHMEFIRAELTRLDLLLHAQILRLRARYQLSLDEFRGLYVSDQQVDALVDSWRESDRLPKLHLLYQQAAALRQQHWKVLSKDSPWQRLISEFNLSCFEADVLLLALAPHVDLKYETVYAYLNNDVTRKWPTFELALDVFSPEFPEKSSSRPYLLADSTLLRNGMLRLLPEPVARATWLAHGISLSYTIAHYLMGHATLDPFLAAAVRPLCVPEAPPVAQLAPGLRQRLDAITRKIRISPDKSVRLLFTGAGSEEKRLAAQVVCSQLRIGLLQLNLQAAKHLPEPVAQFAQILDLERRLRPSGTFVVAADSLCEAEGRVAAESWRSLLDLTERGGPVFVAVPCEPTFPPSGGLDDHRWVTVDFDHLDYEERRAGWVECLSQANCELSGAAIDELAGRFALSHQQVQNAVAMAQQDHQFGAAPEAPLALRELLHAASSQSGHQLGVLAVKVPLVHSWTDLVLPDATLTQVRDFAAAIRNSHVVYWKWGFGERVAGSLGMKVLFAGASGTGKTMSAGVVARDLGLDLYKVDLSTVVSKFIGETEKNLERIFRAAHLSNAILFFDEADALFGKRSEVSDAHDRYANIEVAYLLQKMEEYEGIVILASNLSKNIDQAFSRRMHYVVEFPLPAEAQRERLWRGMFPSTSPLADDVDFVFLARQFPISGGDIRNVALAAAFLAAQNGQRITMRQLIEAMRQQSLKQGKIPSAADFKQYHGWAGERGKASSV